MCRRAKYSLDDDNKRTAQARADEWHERALKLSSGHVEITKDISNEKSNLINAEELTVIKQRLNKIGVKNINNFEQLQSVEVIEKFISQLEYLNKNYDKMFLRIDIVDLKYNDIAQVSPAKVLQLNKRYFNSLATMENIINEFIGKNILPKGANIEYIATHEWAHYITMDDLSNLKSPMYTLFRRTKQKDFICRNSYRDVYEFIADTIACEINGIPCKNAKQVLKYYL